MLIAGLDGRAALYIDQGYENDIYNREMPMGGHFDTGVTWRILRRRYKCGVRKLLRRCAGRLTSARRMAFVANT